MDRMKHGPVAPPAVRYPGKRGGRPTNRPDAETLADLYRTHTARQIAQMYGVAKGTVEQWVWADRHGETRGDNRK